MSNIKRDPDYTLNIFHRNDGNFKQNVVAFVVQTTKIFVSFKYEISLQDEISDHAIKIKITGLHVPELLMPQSGPAQGSRFYENLSGQYEIAVIKQDDTVNEFLVNISGSAIDILKTPKAPFILISNEPAELA